MAPNKPRKRVRQASQAAAPPHNHGDNIEEGIAPEASDNEQVTRDRREDQQDMGHSPRGRGASPRARWGTLDVASWADATQGGSILPTLHNRIPTLTEFEHIKAYIDSLEEAILDDQETCHICGQTFEPGAGLELRRHYRQHNTWRECPICKEDWTHKTIEVRTHFMQVTRTAFVDTKCRHNWVIYGRPMMGTPNLPSERNVLTRGAQ